MEDIENELGLSREDLVALALLLGCDYHDGVPGVGKSKALALFKKLENVNPLER